MKSNNDIKRHILDATVKILLQGVDPELITVRKIAQKANIAIGLINYHFGSKEHLILEAIQTVIENVSEEGVQILTDNQVAPSLRLRQFLTKMSEIVLHYNAYSKILLKHELLSDSFATPTYILGILKEIDPNLSENEVRMLAIQVVAPMQYIFMKENGFLNYQDLDTLAYQKIIEIHLKRLGL
ncbi:TetR/AcrR family transcriptional regulator [Fusibacter bizertensis]